MPKEAEDLVKKIKAGLREKYPKMDEKTLESKAYAIVTKIYQKKGMKAPFA